MGFFGQRFYEIHFGQIVLNKVQFVVNITILLKVFDADLWLYIIAPFVIIFGTWIIGYFGEKTGFRESFMKAQFGGSKVWR